MPARPDPAPASRPFRNRVTPWGDLVAVTDRGTLTGNRGILHEAGGAVVRHHVGKRWIACLLEFRGRRRDVMTPHRWTNLFFLDEATALAAGHRPCAECRRPDYVLFRTAWARAQGLAALPSADAMDLVLHRERALTGGRRTTHRMSAADVPEGAFVVLDGEAWLVGGGPDGRQLCRWTPGGYREHRPTARGVAMGGVGGAGSMGGAGGGGEEVDVLTPPSVVATIRAGYRPAIGI